MYQLYMEDMKQIKNVTVPQYKEKTEWLRNLLLLKFGAKYDYYQSEMFADLLSRGAGA